MTVYVYPKRKSAESQSLAGTLSHRIEAGLLTRPRCPRLLTPRGAMTLCGNVAWDSQQQVLSRILTGFPFNPL